MELRKYLDIVLRWWWLLTLSVVLAAGTAYVVSKLQQPVYQASATLLISEAPKGAASADYTAILTSERLASTYVQLLKAGPILSEVISRLGLAITPEDLAKTITVQLVRDTQLIKVSVESTDPLQAAAVANMLPEVFSDYNQTTQAGRFAESKQNLTDEIAKLDGQIDEIQTRIAALGQSMVPEDAARLDRLQADLTQLRQGRTTLLQSYENLRLAEAQALNNVMVAEPANVPSVPIRPRTATNTALAAMVGLMLAVGVAFLIEYLDDTLKFPDQVTGLLNLPVVGVLARLSAKEMERGPIARVEPRAPSTEAFRLLRTNLQFAGIDRPLRRILVTSVGPQEGKSTVVTNLSIVMAQGGRSVAILDCDLHRPSLHKQLGQLNRLGLSEILLQEQLHLNGALRPAEIPNLALLTSGVMPPNPAELLGSKKMSQLLELVAEEAEVVILDSPPLSALTDAAVLASKVDGVILVVEAAHTRLADALHAKQQLERVGANIVGVVLNKLPLSRRGYYSYYYQYYHYYYYDNGEKKSRRPGNFFSALFHRRKKRHASIEETFPASASAGQVAAERTEPEAGVAAAPEDRAAGGRR